MYSPPKESFPHVKHTFSTRVVHFHAYLSLHPFHVSRTPAITPPLYERNAIIFAIRDRRQVTINGHGIFIIGSWSARKN